ncbi:Lipid A export ATP-binding/permease protein MsbA [Chlamydiales bacterium STE3]|nr:Lipid A export ATP-binding/permease protein MsbA [Chlamydiales bacterium STE3]
MISLFRIVFQHKKYRLLLVVIMICMCLATFASQLEFFAIGVITQKGPNFFELFAPLKDGQLIPQDSVTFEFMQERFEDIAQGANALSSSNVSAFLTTHSKNDFMGSAFRFVDTHFGLTEKLTHLALFLFVIALFKAVTLFAHRFSTKLTAIEVSRYLRQRYFEHIQSLPMSFYQKYDMGTLSSRVVGDAHLVAEAINACFVNYLQTPFTIITTLTLCFLTSWQLSLLIFFGFPLLIFPIVFLARRVKKIAKQIQQNQEKFASVLIDFIAGIQTVKMFAMEDFSLEKYRSHNAKMALLENKSARYDLSSRPIVHTIAMMFLSVALVYGLFVLHMNVSEVLFYCGMLYLFYEPVKKFAEENSQIQRGVAAAERMLEVMALKPEIADAENAEDLLSFEDSITFKDVWFKYNDEWVLKGLDLTIKKGETLAIVGPTGAGKSTIVQLLPRLYDVQKGEICIDGKNIATYKQKSLREKIAFVPQRPFLFMDTVSANIAFGRKFSDEEIKVAATKAFADEFIIKMPNSYATELSEGGKNLSGGQQQRLAIARALVKKDASILVLDEATSSLDAVSENLIKTAIGELRGKITQVLIAHRLSTIEDADRIVYLEMGRKVDEGTKDELLERCEPFRNMWKLMMQKPGHSIC